MKKVRSILVVLACMLMLQTIAAVFADTTDSDLNTVTDGLDGECSASFAGMCGAEFEVLFMENVSIIVGEEAEEDTDEVEEDTCNELLIMFIVIIVIVAAYSTIITITSRGKHKDAVKANFKTTADPAAADPTASQTAAPTKPDATVDV